MDLASFIRDQGDTVEDAVANAAVLLEAKPGAVKSWLYGERLPKPKTARKIVALSKGRVTLAAIYGDRPQ